MRLLNKHICGFKRLSFLECFFILAFRPYFQLFRSPWQAGCLEIFRFRRFSSRRSSKLFKIIYGSFFDQNSFSLVECDLNWFKDGSSSLKFMYSPSWVFLRSQLVLLLDHREDRSSFLISWRWLYEVWKIHHLFRTNININIIIIIIESNGGCKSLKK
jgi:hypothetical protein